MVERRDLPALFMGGMATFAGIGIARLVYTPLFPVLVRNAWFSDSLAVYLSAANLLGYLIGALSARFLSSCITPRWLLALCFSTIALSFFFCMQPSSFVWFFIWRLLAGISGALLMVVGPATALLAIPSRRRTRVGSYLFMGIGFGVILSSVVVPLIMQLSLSAVWLTLGVLSVLAGVVCDRNLMAISPARTFESHASNSVVGMKGDVRFAVFFVILAYALDAVGFIPHTMFWVDYLVREEGLSIHAASMQWTVFGVGAVCGPLIIGRFSQRLGWHSALCLAFIIKALAIAIPILSVSFVCRTLSSFLVGAMVPGIVALTSVRIAELVVAASYKRLWGYATAFFAIAQALAGYMMSALYEVWGSYYLLFYIGGLALSAGAALIFFSGYLADRKTSPSYR